MKKCPECGSELPDNALECNRCGYPFGEIYDENTSYDADNENKKVLEDQINQPENFSDFEIMSSQVKQSKLTQNKIRFLGFFNVHKRIILMIGLFIVIIAVSIVGKGVINEKIIMPNKQYKTAEQMLDNGKYEEAAEEFKNLGNFKDSSQKVDECYYEKGLEDITKGNYEKAISSFEKSITYKGAKDKITECYYLWGISTKEDGNLLEASGYFEKSQDYKDSLEQYNECLYNYAKKVIKETYDYEKAVEYLEKIDYKDSKALVDMYSQFSEGRLFNNKFYWFPKEYAMVLNNIFGALDLDTYMDDMKTSEDLCQFTCYDGYSECATILLGGVNDENGCFDQIRLQGYISNSDIVYPMIALTATVVKDLQVDTAKEIVQELLDMNPSGSLTRDGVHYTYTNSGGFIVYEIEASGENGDVDPL